MPPITLRTENTTITNNTSLTQMVPLHNSCEAHSTAWARHTTNQNIGLTMPKYTICTVEGLVEFYPVQGIIPWGWNDKRPQTESPGRKLPRRLWTSTERISSSPSPHLFASSSRAHYEASYRTSNTALSCRGPWRPPQFSKLYSHVPRVRPALLWSAQPRQ